MNLSSHLVVTPLLLPMLAAAVMLLLGEQRRRAKAWINIGAAALGLVIAVALLLQVDAQGKVQVYLAGNWSAPFGIVLVADRLSALMLVLASTVGLAASIYSSARWDQAGVHFHPLFQLQLMGINGAFLTGDLFNLFVCFEIMLAASYGLLLHGSGRARVLSGLHYIAINLAASSLFLIGASMLYGVTGTLNMADMAERLGTLGAGELGLVHAAAAILAIAFLAKAAMWPLNFWLVPAYSAATAPVGALFALLTKVGVYTLLRLWTLMAAGEAAVQAAPHPWGATWLLAGGLATLAFGAIGLLASQRLGNLAGYSIVVSSGTLLAAMSFGQADLTGAALYYLLSSTLAACTLLLLTDLVERWRNGGAVLAPHEQDGRAPFLTHDLQPLEGVELDDEEQAPTGRAIPAGTAFLGLAFLCCTLLVAGLPPLPAFVGKVAMLSAVFNPEGMGVMNGGTGDITGDTTALAAWALLGLLLVSGLFALIAMVRAGIRHFWTTHDRGVPHLRLAEGLPVAALLVVCVVMAVKAEAVMRYTLATAQALHAPAGYIDAVRNAAPVPNPRHTGGAP